MEDFGIYLFCIHLIFFSEPKLPFWNHFAELDPTFFIKRKQKILSHFTCVDTIKMVSRLKGNTLIMLISLLISGQALYSLELILFLLWHIMI